MGGSGGSGPSSGIPHYLFIVNLGVCIATLDELLDLHCSLALKILPKLPFIRCPHIKLFSTSNENDFLIMFVI